MRPTDLGEAFRAEYDKPGVKEDCAERQKDEVRQVREACNNKERSKKSRGNQEISRQGIRNAQRVNVGGGWQVKDDDPVAAGTVFSYGTDVPPHASFAGGLKENLVLLGQRAFLPVEDLEPTSRYAAEFGQSTSGSTSRAGAADDAPASWRGQPLAPPAEEAHYSLLRSLVRALFLSNGSGAKGMQKGVVPVEALKVLAAKVAQLHGAPLPEGSGFESTSPVNKLNYNDTYEYFSKNEFAVAADFLLAASDPDGQLFEAARGLESGRALPPPTWDEPRLT